MKINTLTPIKNFKDEVIKDELKKDFLARAVLIRCLEVGENKQLELTATSEQRVRAFDLAIEISKNQEVELTAEDIVYIKARLEKLYGSNVLIYVQTLRLLEGSSKTK